MHLKALLGSAALFLGASLGFESSLNVLNPDTGDFGGAAYNLRSEFHPFIDTDFDGNVIAYGVTFPTLSRLGLNETTESKTYAAVLEFDTSNLSKPEQMPITYINVNFNGAGHTGPEYQKAHFDFHIWLEPPEFSRGVECSGNSYPPCSTTPYLAARFNNSGDPSYYPAGYVNTRWVPAMGAHMADPHPTDDFEVTPAYFFGTYNGKLVYYEPMVARTIFNSVENAAAKEFAFPKVQYPVPGRFWTKMRIEHEPSTETYRVTFKDLITNPQKVNSNPVFVGSSYEPNMDVLVGTVSKGKDCIVSSAGTLDAGYMVSTGSDTYCCRSRGRYEAPGSCVHDTCLGAVPLAVPSTAFIAGSSPSCYARCVTLG